MKDQKKKNKRARQKKVNEAKINTPVENIIPENENSSNIVKEAKPDKAKADKAGTEEAKPDKAKADKAGTEEAKQDKAKANKAEIEETKQDKAKANKAEIEETKSKKTELTEAKINTADYINVEFCNTVQDKTEGKEEKTKEISPDGDKGKKNHKKKITGIAIALVLLIIAIAGYGGIAIYYQSHFLPNMLINDIDCSNLDAETVAGILEEQAAGYTLELIGRNADGKQETLGKIQAEDIDLRYTNILVDVTRILDSQDSWLWFQVFLRGENSVNDNSISLISGVEFQKEKLENVLGKLDALQIKNTIAPENAYISEYSETKKGYEIISEVMGTQLDPEAVISAVEAAIYEHNTKIVDLYEQGCYVQPKITSQDEELLEKCNTMNKWVGAEIVYDWNGNEVIVNAEQIHNWILFNNDKLELNKEEILDFIKEKAKEFDTYGRNRKFVTTLGVELTLPGGAYGWKTDSEGEAEELIQAIENGKKVKKEPLFISKGAKKGSNDIGTSYVEADLSNQHLYLYQNGTVVLETDFVSGNMSNGCTTPPGVFGITYKTTNAVLRGADYVTPVQYWMPFNGNVGMHDATWRSEFGGDIFLENGSHGCINLPLDMAEAIYGYMSAGFPVICYYY